MNHNYKKIKSTIAAFALMASATLTGQITYCSTSPFSAGDDEIFNVTIGTLNNTSNCNQTGGPGSSLNQYSDYTNATPAVPVPTLLTGNTYSMSVTVGQCSGFVYDGIFVVWIDFNQNGSFSDPGEAIYTSVYSPWAVAGTTFTFNASSIPLTATSGLTRMRITADESTQAPTPCGTYGYGETEDYNVYIASIPCAGTPAANMVSAPGGSTCPNANVTLSLATQYTASGGMTYQWQSSTTSSVGPFNAISGGTLNSIVTSATVTTYYSAIIVCTNGGGTITATAGQVLIAGTTTNTAPYFEGFEGISNNSQMPNCSWAVSNASTCITHTDVTNSNGYPNTGNNYARFEHYDPNSFSFISGTSDYYTNGIYLYSGVTYSANMYYMLDYSGNTNWTNLSIWVCPGQSTTGATAIISQGPVVVPNYKAFGNTFTVPTSGLYYIGISATSDGNCCSGYISWDDLSITIPCSLNSPTLNVVANQTAICQGQSVNITASGMGSYNWSNGATTSTITATPSGNITYNVVGLNAITGCTATASQNILVNPSPVVSIFSPELSVCKGSSVTMLAIGANVYSWNNNVSTAQNIVSPAVPTTYSVTGTNQFGCSSTQTIQIGVNNLPQINVSSTSGQICLYETATLSATGAGATGTYTWASTAGLFSGASVVVSPLTTITYTAMGKDANGCVGSSLTTINVAACLGITQSNTASGNLTVYPNPTSGKINLAFNNTYNKLIELSDLTGRVVYTANSSDANLTVNIENFANGIYYLNVKSELTNEFVKIIKQ